MIPDWSTIRVDEAACEASKARFPELRCFTGVADTPIGDERLLVRAGDQEPLAEGSLLAKATIDGRPTWVAELLHVEGDHAWASPLLIAFDTEPDDGRFRLVRCVPLYANAVDDLEAFRREVVRRNLAYLEKRLSQQKAMAALLPSAQAQVDQVEGSIQEIAAWLSSSGRDLG